ncbi:MAG: hypothetical protein GX677_07500 [Treponema sp.]|jgi:hypothetical protein|nr:hypothetical protein [Treponema sp.]
MNKNIFNKKHIPYFIILSVIVISFLISVIFCSVKNKERRIFIFPSETNQKLVVERRLLEKDSIQGDIELYIDELLLGSTIERTKLIFSSGTKIKSCFLRNGILYLNITDDLIRMDSNSMSIKEGIDLLKKNIMKNFNSVKAVELFINEQYAYENL